MCGDSICSVECRCVRQEMDQITPDIEQWLLADQKVLSKCRNIARRLGLTQAQCVLDVECWGGGGGRKGRGGERFKLEMLLRMWKEKNPDTYNVRMLKTLLAAEGLADMWMWINIITQDTSHRPHIRGSDTSPASPTSPWSRYLYSSPKNSPTFLSNYPESSFSHHSLSSGANSPVHSSPSHSRPASQLSDYKAYSTSSSPHPLSTSCPNTPHLYRRHSPSTHSSSQTSSSVYSLLYRPDLIQLSSPRLFIRQREEGKGRNISSQSNNDFNVSLANDATDMLAIQKDKDNNVNEYSANEETKYAESDMTMIDDRTVNKGTKYLFENLTELKSKQSLKEEKSSKKFNTNKDEYIIGRVNQMNDDFIDTFMDGNHGEPVRKNKSSVKDDDNSFEESFDNLLRMIQKSVKDLNV
eukprot:GFUD01000440.1.p1 GENE.GFUD01000440.1~~GFUD01000440.1.p1  ORF type:complete len:411 (-),score=125.59 GFUD01000440.1:30-1262(-)